MSVGVCCFQTALHWYSGTHSGKILAQRARHISTSPIDSSVRQFVYALAKWQPCFPVHSSAVQIMVQPKEFYQCLLSMIRRAKRRLVISSLYIGSEDLELVNTLRASLVANPALQVYMHLDYNRCTRPEPLSTANLLLPLLQDFPDRVHVWLFRSPKLKGLMAKIMPPRFNEGWGGTWHAKIYGADDDVLISGANLNTSYFTNRQDRYISFTGQPALAQYCFSFLQQTSTFSYALLPSSSDKDQYVLRWPDEQTHPHHFEPKAQKLLTTFQNGQITDASKSIETVLNDSDEKEAGKPDVLVMPIIQAGQFGIREEERCLSLLFNQLSKGDFPPSATYSGSLMDLTSGYFGLYKPYQDLIVRSPVACRILAAGPKANGFYGSKGVSGRIPEGYTVLERRFMKAVRGANREWTQDEGEQASGSGVELSEWERKGWTYHAKGIWLRPTPLSYPVLTLFGSTNLNSRSANIDTELSFVMVTTAPALQERLAEEVDGLRAHGHAWQGAERRVRPGSWVLASALCNRL